MRSRRLLSFMSFLSYCEPALWTLESRADTRRCTLRQGRGNGVSRLRLRCGPCRDLPRSATSRRASCRGGSHVRDSGRMSVMPTGTTDRKLEIVTAVPDRAMVILAHPDDAELGSGGVVARWAAAGCEVTYVLCTNGQAGTADRSLAPAELAQRRAAEQRAAADFMGVTHLVMLGYPDGELEDTRAF